MGRWERAEDKVRNRKRKERERREGGRLGEERKGRG